MPPRKLSRPRKLSYSKASLSSIPFSYASVSVGSPSTPLPEKLSAISGAGFTAIELGFPDLLSFSSSHLGKEVKEDDFDSLCQAGKEVKRLCGEKGLRIMMLQPFSNFEGWEDGSKEREDAFERAAGWVRIMEAVGTDMLQVGSTDSPSPPTTSSFNRLAMDLASLADLLAPHSFRLAYENWCWATHAPTWSSVWQIVQAANRPNIGLCLDTFQTICGEYGDPTTPSTLIQSAGLQQKLEHNLTASLQALQDTVPADKIYVLQLSDAYRPPAPFKADGENGEGNEEPPGGGGSKIRARAKWSHDYRPYLYSGGAFTPQCVEMCKAVLGTGFRGWFSVEVFDGMNEGGKKDMKAFCQGAMESCRTLIGECAGEVSGVSE
ncbi:3-dehydroshikimate dehydratase [Lachnellula occidentalis]|uniref:3-dehydroshikimate dehydratase n=1 Tax=Lachnellula occidentalis TaxID=215460 RepID=A0A8H8RWQ9_9HELO|nr:3-dehydroshikimate dehydratase [Lachnellula occidentalis]